MLYRSTEEHMQSRITIKAVKSKLEPLFYALVLRNQLNQVRLPFSWTILRQRQDRVDLLLAYFTCTEHKSSCPMLTRLHFYVQLIVIEYTKSRNIPFHTFPRSTPSWLLLSGILKLLPTNFYFIRRLLLERRQILARYPFHVHDRASFSIVLYFQNKLNQCVNLKFIQKCSKAQATRAKFSKKTCHHRKYKIPIGYKLVSPLMAAIKEKPRCKKNGLHTTEKWRKELLKMALGKKK